MEMTAQKQINGLVGVSPIHAFWNSIAPKECPKISEQMGIQVDNIQGPWRIAYVFLDDGFEEFNEDGTCAIAHFTQKNETNLKLMLFMDEKIDDFTIDRFIKDFDLKILSPGEWLLHTSLEYLEFIHITAIELSKDHLILTFCAAPFTGEGSTQKPYPDEVGDYNSFLLALDKNKMRNIFNSQSYKRYKNSMNANERYQKIRRPTRLLRGRRYAEYSQDSDLESFKEKLAKYIITSTGSTKKHLWTAILVRNVNASALNFVENAAILMKHGYDVTKGQLVSFNSCYVAK